MNLATKNKFENILNEAKHHLWIGEVKGQNAGWRGNQRGVSRHLEGGLGA